MSHRTNPAALPELMPHYRGQKWISVDLPKTATDWSSGGEKSILTDGNGRRDLIKTLTSLNDDKAWRWPKRQHLFFSDLHADSDALAASLVASGSVRKLGPEPSDFRLTSVGRQANFVIGGDCFDKGPSSLDLLHTVRHLKAQGARVRVLAGNHDIRLLFGMRAVGKGKDAGNEHFFIRTGRKIIPLLVEVWEKYLENGDGLKGIPDQKNCRQRLYPRDSWFDEFPKLCGGNLLRSQCDRELSKIATKVDRFEHLCADAGLSLRQVYAAVQKWKSLFVEKDGQFRWFYKNMRLCYRNGSFLFVHAGVDDVVAKILLKDGVKHLNRSFRRAMTEPRFDFYYSPLGNTIRTKYRDVDRPFTEKGARNIRRAGITAIIHGHRNLHNGQRLSARKSQLNFECDTSLDRHTRRVEDVGGRGASVTIVDPGGYILGVSSDYPQIKVFHPRHTLNALVARERKEHNR